MPQKVVTRFAPSPTGYLHIGGARTALFNWLFARHHGGKFLLRIEDTDRKRSTEAATKALLKGLKWMGLNWDGEEIYQFAQASRHQKIANTLLENGNAYWCYERAEDLAAARKAAEASGEQYKYDRKWRDAKPEEAPSDIKPALRLKAPLQGTLTITDRIRGDITIDYGELDDMVLLRADGSPTYMLAVVVDDFDMGVTHIIRGDDHLTNSFRQALIYQAMGWDMPEFAHLPLIHGPDGAKLSKRHGALGVEQYEAMGYLPEAMFNYLLRLGWSHGDDEMISKEQAIEWFSIKSVGKSPSRFDIEKLNHLNNHYIQAAEPARLAKLMLGEDAPPSVIQLISLFVSRANTLIELAEELFFASAARPIALDEKAATLLDDATKANLAIFKMELEAIQEWTEDNLKAWGEKTMQTNDLKMKQIMMPLRAALLGRTNSPSVYAIMAALGQEEVLGRLDDIA